MLTIEAESHPGTRKRRLLLILAVGVAVGLAALQLCVVGCAIGPKQDDPLSATSLPPTDKDAGLLQDDGIRGGGSDALVSYADASSLDAAPPSSDVDADAPSDGANDATSFDGDAAATIVTEVSSDAARDE